ncbi:MAG: ABC transporter ATP-binding protein [Candidatus Paceibacterota bacterium]|jgi:ABC-type multidrug transport system fused ATPase/permease subunit
MDKQTNTKSEYKIRDGVLAVWKLSAPHRRTMGVLAGLGVVSAVASAFTPYLSGRFFDALTLVSGKGTPASLVPVFAALALWFFAQIVQNIVSWFQAFISRGLPLDMEASVYERGLSHLLRLPIAFHKEHRVSEIREIYNRAMNRVPSIINDSLAILPDFLSVVLGIAIAFTLNATLSYVLLGGAVAYAFVMIRTVQKSASTQVEANAFYQKAYGRASNSIMQIDVVKISGAEDYENKERNKDLGAARNAWKNLENIWARLDGFQRTVVFVVQGTIFVFSVNLVSSGTITLGTLVAFNGYAMMFLSPIVRLGMTWQRFQNGFVAADTFYKEILDKPTEIYQPENALPLGEMEGEVEFKNVSFRYSDGDINILDNVSFIARKGETVALVGESGVGKSTTISLISGMYFPTNGSVKIDGKDIRMLDLKELRSHIAIVPQELSLFNDTIEANITYGTFDATHEQVVAAAAIAQADGFINKMPNGYETTVGERGVKLSVGQKQRIAIARAVLRNPAILILDEPTSALDSKTEKELTKSLEELMRGRTTVIVAHRLSTVRKADKIAVIEEGKLVESGTHNELIQKEGGRYKMMYEHNIGLGE